MATTIRFNVSFAPHDGVLRETLKKISEPTIVDSHEARNPGDAAGLLATRVGNVVDGKVENPLFLDVATSGCTLDLVAHADSGGVLQFGDWAIDASEDHSRELNKRWEALKVKPRAIRLLGCNTGLFRGGQAAMRHLSAVFGDVEIFGAIGVLDASNFEPGGLNARSADALLLSSDELRDPEDPASERTAERQFQMMAQAPQIDDVFVRLRAETLDEATYNVRSTLPRYRWPVNHCTRESWNNLSDQLVQSLDGSAGGFATAPGLLAVPEAEVLLPVEGSAGEPRFHRATILLGGWFVRIYPIGVPAGVILRSHQVLQLDPGIPVQLPAVAPDALPTDTA